MLHTLTARDGRVGAQAGTYLLFGAELGAWFIVGEIIGECRFLTFLHFCPAAPADRGGGGGDGFCGLGRRVFPGWWWR